MKTKKETRENHPKIEKQSLPFVVKAHYAERLGPRGKYLGYDPSVIFVSVEHISLERVDISTLKSASKLRLFQMRFHCDKEFAELNWKPIHYARIEALEKAFYTPIGNLKYAIERAIVCLLKSTSQPET